MRKLACKYAYKFCINARPWKYIPLAALICIYHTDIVILLHWDRPFQGVCRLHKQPAVCTFGATSVKLLARAVFTSRCVAARPAQVLPDDCQVAQQSSQREQGGAVELEPSSIPWSLRYWGLRPRSRDRKPFRSDLQSLCQVVSLRLYIFLRALGDTAVDSAATVLLRRVERPAVGVVSGLSADCMEENWLTPPLLCLAGLLDLSYTGFSRLCHPGHFAAHGELPILSNMHLSPSAGARRAKAS